MEAEVESLRTELEKASKEAEVSAISTGKPLPDNWAAPMQMATQKTLRQVAAYGESMEAEVESLKSQLESASTEAEAALMARDAMAEELSAETRKKEMHHDKARQFYAEAAEAKAALASAQAELDQLRDAGDA